MDQPSTSPHWNTTAPCFKVCLLSSYSVAYRITINQSINQSIIQCFISGDKSSSGECEHFPEQIRECHEQMHPAGGGSWPERFLCTWLKSFFHFCVHWTRRHESKPSSQSPSSIPLTIEAKLSSNNITSAACLLTSEPLPIAIPAYNKRTQFANL